MQHQGGRDSSSNYGWGSLDAAAQQEVLAGRAYAAAPPHGPPPLLPLRDLNPYQLRWAVRGRVSSKLELAGFVGPRGNSGTFFSFVITDDANGDELQVVAFNADAHRIFPCVSVNSLVQLEGNRGDVKFKNAQHNRTNNSYEVLAC
ncbi:hypothetical protein T492DRAFT_478060 [Pavlovales sp. CCMP2436]|nr:hypothetical protein T492DRAFT_478060 [Pavlovales sp. CCMP2436]